MRILSLLLLLLLTAGPELAQAQILDSTQAARIRNKKPKREYDLPDPKPFAEGIRAEDLRPLVQVLASDSLEGRETGKPGQRKAANFIAQQFKALNLPTAADRNTYFQAIHLQRESWKTISLRVGEQEFKNRTDFYVFPNDNPSTPQLDIKELVFVGYGVQDSAYNDYDKVDIKGKAVLMYDGEPMDASGKSLITKTEFRSPWSLDWKRKVRLAQQKGAVMVFIIDPKFSENIKNNRRQTSTYGWKPTDGSTTVKPVDLVNSMFVSPDVATAMLGKKAGKAEEALSELRNGEKFKAVKLKSKITVNMDKEIKTLEGSNVIGLIEGSDPNLKNEYVFITAHYDHLGIPDSTVIYYGADDNASGTAGVIEIARAFAEAKRKGVGPKRSVVCMLVSGEEKGLLGSSFYVQFPIFPLKNTVVDVNIDMIGRIDDRHAGNPNYIYVIGADRLSSDLHAINEQANKDYTQLELDYKYNDPADKNRYYERSDHYNFAERGIPAIFYFNGTHADYHKPTDTADKIDYNALAKRAQLAFHTAWEIANRPWRLPVDKK
ncbi:MAG TPA: M28 family peptidase [Saprospiraceae bacterium]|nr:M28 family peptidase [Saprospiraceae bacterium]